MRLVLYGRDPALVDSTKNFWRFLLVVGVVEPVCTLALFANICHFAWAFFVSSSLILALCLLAILFGLQYGAYFWPNQTRIEETDAATFTVMTFNIWWMSQKRSTAKVPLLNTLPTGNRGVVPAGYNPDLVALQELEPPMADLLLSEVGQSYPYHHFDVTDAEGQRLGVLSRFLLTPLDAKDLRTQNFRLQIVRVNFPERPFLLYNIHPRATNIVHYFGTPRSFVHRVRQGFHEREEFIRLLLADIATRDEPVVVVGDFNSTDLSDVYRLMSKNLTDAHRAAGWGLGYTFPAHGRDFKGVPVPRRFMRLDMIFHSDEFVARHCLVGRAHGESDHLPVLAEFMLR